MRGYSNRIDSDRQPLSSKTSGETARTTPPSSNSPNFIENPPLRKRPEKLLQLPPPLEFTELYRLPPLPNILPWNSPDFVES